MKNKKEKGKQLEYIVADYLKPLDKNSRPTRGSGNGTEIGDVINNICYVEAKNWNKSNLIIDMSIWQHLINQLPISTNKFPILVQKNNEDKIFISLDIKDFFNILYKAYKIEE